MERLVGERRGTLLLLFTYALAWWFFLPNAGLESDDGSWIAFMHRFSTGDLRLANVAFPRPAPGDRHFSNSLLPAVLHQLPWAVGGSVRSLYVWSLLLGLFAHFIVIEAGTTRRDRIVLQIASLWYFWSPAFSVYYGLRAWQLAYLPPCIAGVLFGMLRYAERGELRLLCVGMVSAGLAMHAHPGALLLLPGLALAFYTTESDAQAPRNFAIASAAYLAVTAPFWGYLVRIGKGPVVVLLVVGLAATALARKFFPRRDRFLPFAVVLLPVIAALAIPFAAPFHRPLAVLMDIAAAPSGWVARKAELSGAQSRFSPWMTPAALTWVAGIVLSTCRYPRAEVRDRVLWCLAVPPVAALSITAAVYADWPHQRVVFVFPTAFVSTTAVLLGRFRTAETTLPPPLLGWIAILVGLGVISTLDLERRLSENGGVRAHCASLSEKQDVAAWIRSRSRSPRLVVVDRKRQWGGCNPGGWDSLLAEGTLSCPSEPNTFYVIEPHSQGYEEAFTTRVEALPRLSERTFRSVRVVESSELHRGLGTVVEPPGCSRPP